jgi:tRNA dimethylallyltransferase
VNGAEALPWLKDVLTVVGPTAAGKSEAALELALRLGGELISVDSMQVYRGMDIGTAKPSAEERDRVLHHLIDIAEVSQPFDAAQFVAHARKAIEQVLARGRVPILCGGTGLYLRALFEGLGQAPSGSARLRAELEATPLSDLLKELADRDPDTFARIDVKNPRRVVRAVEVIRLSGKAYSLQRASWNNEGSLWPLTIGLLRERDDLVQRIERRVDKIFQQGLVAETEALLKVGLRANPTAMQALGYRQVVEHLEGTRSLSETVELVKARTRQYAKRQMTWFTRQCSVDWIRVEPASSVDDVVAEAARRWERVRA